MYDTESYFRRSFFTAVALSALLFNVAYCYISFVELGALIFGDAGSRYPWKAEGMPWFYDTRRVYVLYHGSWALGFAVLLVCQVAFLLRKEKRRAFLAGIAFAILFTVMLVINRMAGN